MPTYIYRVKTADGKEKQGEIVAKNEIDARTQLIKQRFQIISLQPKTEATTLAKIKVAFRPKVSQQALTVFSRQFATMINAGLSLVRALDILAEQTEDKILKQAIMDIKKEVEGGKALSAALAKHRNVFSDLYISMVKAGEIGGMLDEVLERLANFMEKDFQLKKKVQSAMTYPAIILFLAIGIVIFLVTYILPTFVNLFKEMEVQLPFITQILITVVEGLRRIEVVVTLLVLLIVGIIGLNFYYQTSAGKRTIDLILLNIPIFGILNKKVAISRFSRTLGTLLSSGVSLLASLEIVSQVAGNAVISNAIDGVRSKLREGENLSGPLSETGIFPPMVTQMIAVGEETGNLDTMLNKIADFYDTEVEYTLSSLTSLLEPIMIVGMGGIVGFIVLAVFLPLYQLITASF
ncbi:MAG: type II secretion system F family protein [Candidatus Calescibacterium sp.]|nr:type II secretion system F family protein [Candidatus Calescibacterium sp.]MCX7972771.1 type II secretion system F family protein [bacterium]MDW8195419.1 type II secretion system F family protein [Candidatus Calescibacterium sp.]